MYLRHTVRRPKGHISISEPDKPLQEADTVQCVHCQAHWIVEPGSGRRRGYCFRCDGPTCGSQPCTERCLPFEKALEMMESRAALDRSLEHIRNL